MFIRFSATRTALAAVVLAATLGACSDEVVDPGTTDIPVPATYSFTSRFDASKSSVDYGGQIVRNMLVTDLISTLSGLARAGAAPVTEAELIALYEHSDAANLASKITVTGKEILESKYAAISTGKKLSDKIGGGNAMGVPSPMTADALVRDWLRQAALNSQDPTKLGTNEVKYDANGYDIPEIVGKVLFGAISYYQATSVYMANVLTKDNAAAADDGKGGKLAYTVMEHNWDESFGYFGAARDFARYSDEQLTGTAADYTYDSNGDGKIDLRSEYNYTLARYAARLDKPVPGTNLTKEIFDAYLTGRTAITNQGTTEEISAQRRIAVEGFEKVMAGSLVRYLNGVKKVLATMNTPTFDLHSYRHQWSEMKGFAIALQYNSMKKISDAQLAQLHTLVGSAPMNYATDTEKAVYVAALDQAAQLLKGVYGFSDAQITTW